MNRRSDQQVETGGAHAAAASGDNAHDDAVYRDIFALSGIGQFQITPEGRYLKANPALAEILGFDSAAALLAAEAGHAGALYLEPGRFAELRRALDAEGRVAGFLSRVRRRDGQVIWVSETANAIRDAEGRVLSYVGTLEDVTGRVEAEAASRRALQSYRDIFTNASEGIYRTTRDGRLLRANPALVRMMGYDSEADFVAALEAIDREIYVQPGRRAEFVRRIERDGRVESFVSEAYRHGTGERLWITENARVVRDAAGRTLYYEGTLQDITERKQAEMALLEARIAAEQANRAKTQFLANMSHELRTPLNAIIGFAEMLENEVFGPLGAARYREYVRDIHASGHMLLQLLNDLLDLAKVEAGKLELREESVDLAALARNCVRMMTATAAEREVRLACHGPRRSLRLLGDERRLRQILLNLVSNAVKYNRRGGGVSVEIAVAPDGGLILAVEDEGPGIPPDQIERVFEPFVQLQTCGQTTPEGVGLGLPLCRQLVERHGGRLTISSREGHGTRAQAHFPRERVLAADRPAR